MIERKLFFATIHSYNNTLQSDLMSEKNFFGEALPFAPKGTKLNIFRKIFKTQMNRGIFYSFHL